MLLEPKGTIKSIEYKSLICCSLGLCLYLLFLPEQGSLGRVAKSENGSYSQLGNGAYREKGERLVVKKVVKIT